MKLTQNSKILIILIIAHINLFPINLWGKDEIDLNINLLLNYYHKTSNYTQKYLSNLLNEETNAQSKSIKKENANKKDLKRILLIGGSIWLADSIRYWKEYTSWIEDWQFNLNWKDQSERFFTLHANKFDSNPFLTNILHNFAGTFFYDLARYHNLNLFESLMCNIISSLAWEYITEWREVISINDNLSNISGGFVMGETSYQLGNFLLNKQGIFNNILGYILNPVFAFNDLLGGKKIRKANTYNNLSNFSAFLTISNKNIRLDKNGESHNLLRINFHSNLSGFPVLEETDKNNKSGFIKFPFYSGMDFDISLKNSEVEELGLNAKVIYLGYYKQNLKKEKNGFLKGQYFFIGMSSAYSLYKKRAVEEYDKGEYHYDFTGEEKPEQPVNFTDKHSIMDLIGPSFYYGNCFSHITIKTDITAYLDFGLINSLALNTYSEKHDIFSPRMKTTLIYYGYYYALGYTVESNSELSISNLSFYNRLRYRKFNSIQGLDRFQYLVKDDSKVTDSRFELWTSLIYKIPRTNFFFSFSYEKINRSGTIHNTLVKQTENRVYISLGIKFIQ